MLNKDLKPIVNEVICQEGFCSRLGSVIGVGGPRAEASEEAPLLFRPGRESLCLLSSLDILVSVKQNK